MEKQITILIADDDLEDHDILMNYFMERGFGDVVGFFENGQKAIEYLERTDDQSLPLLIVLDLNMPILNGTQTLQLLKDSDRLEHIPVIVYSTSDNENERKKSLRLGAVDYLVKPNSYAEGLTMIGKFIDFLPADFQNK